VKRGSWKGEGGPLGEKGIRKGEVSLQRNLCEAGRLPGPATFQREKKRSKPRKKKGERISLTDPRNEPKTGVTSKDREGGASQGIIEKALSRMRQMKKDRTGHTREKVCAYTSSAH